MPAHAMQGDRERFLAAGMDNYISKPIKAQELYRLIQDVAGAESQTPSLVPVTSTSNPITPD